MAKKETEQRADKTGKPLEPGDEITVMLPMNDFRAEKQYARRGYYGGVRNDKDRRGSLILFLRGEDGELERCYFWRTPVNILHKPNRYPKITNRQKDNQHGKEETGREGQ